MLFDVQNDIQKLRDSVHGSCSPLFNLAHNEWLVHFLEMRKASFIFSKAMVRNLCFVILRLPFASHKPWRTWITIADVAIWTLSAAGVGIAVMLLIRNRNLKGEDAKA